MNEIKLRILSLLKAAIVEEKLDGFDVDDTGNLDDLLRVVFIDEKCGNLKVVIESLLEIKSDLLHAYIDVHSVTNAVGESISSISKWKIVNQLGKHDFSCG